MSNTKNAYEIRLDILRMANDNVWQKWHTDMDAERRNTQANGDDSGSWIKKISSPTTDDVIKEANELYKFICQE